MNWNEFGYTVLAIIIGVIVLKFVFKAVKWLMILLVLLALAATVYFYFW